MKKNTYYIIGKNGTLVEINKKTFEILYAYNMKNCISARILNGEFELNHEIDSPDIYKPLSGIELRAFLWSTFAALGFMDVTNGQNEFLYKKISNGENVHVAILQ